MVASGKPVNFTCEGTQTVYCVHTVSLAKAFAQEVLYKSGFATEVKVRKGDLAVVLGTETANNFICGVTEFLSSQHPIDFKSVQPLEVSPPGSRYENFADVIDVLKTAYEKTVKKRRTRVGVHHYMPYDTLFKKFKDRVALSEDLDYYCDFGAIVPEIMIQGGKVMRGCRTGEPDSEYNVAILRSIYAQLLVSLDCLPREEKPLLATRLRNQARERACNCATAYVYKNKLTQIVLLYLDFSGLRDIPEPKEDQISEYYAIVDRNVRARNGQKLYGGKDGDDAFAILFTDVRPALQCAQDIKKDFSEDLLLRAGKTDIKFGLCFTIFQNEQKETEIIQCWGTAKDCCEFKGDGFRNRGDLLTF